MGWIAQSEALHPARLGLGPRLLRPAGPGEGPSRILTHTSSGLTPPGPHPRQGPASEQPIFSSVTGRADPRPLPNALPVLGQPPSRPGACTCRSGCCITYMSPGLRTARPCSPVRTCTLPAPWLPRGSCYPNNNTESPGTSMEWGGGK